MRFVLLLALVAASLPLTAAASTRKPEVVLLNSSPVTVRGTGFHRSERVVVTVAASSMGTKKAIASTRGAFRIVFPGLKVGYCEGYTIRAKGNRGSNAFVRIIPECPSQGPED
ncbi:MAG: hypothetical protein ACJ74I_02920 [Gaiellaceae bacterium]